MLITDLIKELEIIKEEYGNIEVCHYNNMDYWNYPLKVEDLKIVFVKSHLDCDYVYCNPKDEWIDGQEEFDKQKSFKVLSI